MSLEGSGRSFSPETPPLEDGVTEQQQGIIDRLTELDARARAAEHNELQMYRLLVPRLVDELNAEKAQNENLQQMIRESKPAPEEAGGEP